MGVFRTLDNFFVGDTVSYQITVTDDVTGLPIDVSNQVLWITFKSHPEDADAIAALQFSSTLPADSNSQAGKVPIIISTNQTTTLAPGLYYWSFQLVDNSQTPPVVTTIGHGVVRAKRNLITRIA